MKNLWSKEDLANFNNSEVFSELEARVVETIRRADILSKKIAQTEMSTQKMKEIGNVAVETKKQVDALNEALSSADDEELDDEDDAAFDGIVEELTSMAKLAIDQGDYKLAYRIERTIDEILEPEVKCE
jgi:hypothetical protein